MPNTPEYIALDTKLSAQLKISCLPSYAEFQGSSVHKAFGNESGPATYNHPPARVDKIICDKPFRRAVYDLRLKVGIEPVSGLFGTDMATSERSDIRSELNKANIKAFRTPYALMLVDWLCRQPGDFNQILHDLDDAALDLCKRLGPDTSDRLNYFCRQLLLTGDGSQYPNTSAAITRDGRRHYDLTDEGGELIAHKDYDGKIRTDTSSDNDDDSVTINVTSLPSQRDWIDYHKTVLKPLLQGEYNQTSKTTTFTKPLSNWQECALVMMLTHDANMKSPQVAELTPTAPDGKAGPNWVRRKCFNANQEGFWQSVH